MIKVDSHCHFWSLSRGDYHWLDPNDPFLAPIARDFAPKDIQPDLNAAGVQQIVVVQAAATEAETEYLLRLSEHHPQITGVVGWIDLTSEKSALETLERWQPHPKFKGIRPMLQDIEQTDWLIQVPSAHFWDHLVQGGLSFDALVQPRHLSMLLQFSEKHPDLPIVIDHVAKPKEILNAQKTALKIWTEGMTLLAQNPLIYCKFSGLLSELAHPHLPNSDLKSIFAPVIDTLLATFGAKRIMWGSDWPVLTLASDYQRWDELVTEMLDGLDTVSINAIRGDAATDFYRLKSTS